MLTIDRSRREAVDADIDETSTEDKKAFRFNIHIPFIVAPESHAFSSSRHNHV